MLKGEVSQDSAQIKKVFEEKYPSLPIFMFHNGKQFPVKVISIDEKGIIIKSVNRVDKDSRIITLTHEGNLYKFTMEFLGASGNFEILNPVVLEKIPASRLLNRIKPDRLYITNISNQSDIIKSIVSDSVRVNNILRSFQNKVKDKIPNLELFIHERQDVRLKLLNDHDKIIFIPNKNEKETVTPEYVPYFDYINQLKNAKGMDRIVSEITIPIKFKGMFTLGYLSAQHYLPMDESYLQVVNALATNIKKEILSQPIINESKEASMVVDINSEGFSIFHTNFANFGKLFSIGGIIIFDLCSSPEDKIVAKAIIRNIKATEKQFRIGCQFYSNSPEDFKPILDFLKKHIPNLEIKETAPPPNTDSQPPKK